MLLGDVDELEEEREGPQHGGLPLEARGAATASPSASRDPPRAGIARERADPLLVVEQVLSLLLDEHAPEQVAEQAHVGAERGVGGHRPSLENGRSQRTRHVG